MGINLIIIGLDLDMSLKEKLKKLCKDADSIFLEDFEPLDRIFKAMLEGRINANLNFE